MRIGHMELRFSKRSGNAFVLWKDCFHSFEVSPPRHMRGFYFQFGKWGGHIMWDSQVCYEGTGG
jgi:hypothetical protein